MATIPTVVVNFIGALFFAVVLGDAFSPIVPLQLKSWERRAELAEGTVESSPADTPSKSKGKGFWYQPPSIIRSRLQSPPPDKILAQIQAEPYRGGFEPVQDFPHYVTPKIVQGSIPNDLVGTLAINSAGRIRIGGRMMGHWFDGDGYIATLSFDGKKNEARAFGRYIRTERFKAQEQLEMKDNNASDDLNSEPPLAYMGPWTKAGTGKWYENIGKTPQSPANTAIMWLPPLDPSSNPRLFALCEGGDPVELNPITLEVIRDGPFTSSPSAWFGETVSSYFSAHFSQDPHTQHIFNHGYILDPLSSLTSINLMELSAEGYLLKQQRCEMPFHTFVHDATISQTLFVYFVCPYIIPSGPVELVPLITGQKTMGEMMTWKGGPSIDEKKTPSYLQVHSKDDLNLKWSIVMPDPMSLYHIVDAFEEERTSDGSDLLLKVRVAEHNSNPPGYRNRIEEQFANQYEVPSGERIVAKLKEYTFALRDDGEGTLLSSKDLSSSTCEFPETNQVGRDQRLRYTWINELHDKSAGWFDAVQKVDMEDGGSSSSIVSFGQGTYCGPPLFIPKVADAESDAESTRQYEEDEGYVVVVLYRSETHTSDIVVLDACSMDLLCTLELECHLPYSFHGKFQPRFVSP
ncbi:hypothetical protein ACHAXR_009711 [Thalassiosira sp. AJA248-18]